MSSRIRAAALAALVFAAAATASCSGRLFGRQYEYEEDMTLDLDGSATVIVNASIASLVALRGLDLDPSPTVRYDSAKLRAAYESPVVEVIRVSRTPWRRSGRRFVQIRLQVPDIRKLPQAPPFAWSRYELTSAEEMYTFKQVVGPSALRRGTLRNVGWNGREVVAFRLHLPSRVIYHNARDIETNETLSVQRGNILGWEQALADRLDGVPLEIEVRMEGRSILYRALWLFGGAFAAAVGVLAFLIWLAMRKGRKAAATTGP